MARDKAFCFYYEDNLDLLKEMGAEICFFSPMHHRNLPENIDGIYIGGGYPELYLRELCENSSMLQDIKEAVTLRKIPCMAECGGFMYLHDIVKDKTGQSYPMVGLVPGESFYAGKLVRFGYIDMEALKDNMLLKAGERIRGHEFHYWDSTNPGELFLARKPLRKKNWNCIYGDENLYAGYPHVHFYSNISAAERFMDRCREKR